MYLEAEGASTDEDSWEVVKILPWQRELTHPNRLVEPRSSQGESVVLL